jgi:hypothetical protein
VWEIKKRQKSFDADVGVAPTPVFLVNRNGPVWAFPDRPEGPEKWLASLGIHNKDDLRFVSNEIFAMFLGEGSNSIFFRNSSPETEFESELSLFPIKCIGSSLLKINMRYCCVKELVN